MKSAKNMSHKNLLRPLHFASPHIYIWTEASLMMIDREGERSI